MARVTRFEDLVAWQRSRALASAIYRITFRGALARDYSMQRQLRSAALSIPSNIAEGFERFRPKEFHHFLSIAKASCAEVRSQLYVAFDLEYITEDVLITLRQQAESAARTIGKLRASVERRIKPPSTQHPAPSTK